MALSEYDFVIRHCSVPVRTMLECSFTYGRRRAIVDVPQCLMSPHESSSSRMKKLFFLFLQEMDCYKGQARLVKDGRLESLVVAIL